MYLLLPFISLNNTYLVILKVFCKSRRFCAMTAHLGRTQMCISLLWLALPQQHSLLLHQNLVSYSYQVSLGKALTVVAGAEACLSG